MIHRTSTTMLGVATAVALVALAGCSASPAEKPAANGDQYTIAAMFPNTSDPFWQTMACGAADRAAELGVDLQQFNATNTDTNAIASNFQTASLIGADGMIVNSFNNNQFVAQVTELMASGVPVVTGNASDPQSELTYLASDPDTAGLAAELADAIPAGEGSMIYMGGAPGIPPLEARTLPFYEAVKELRPDLTVLPEEYSGFDINTATTDIASIIIANPDLKLIIAATGPDGVGAAAALEQAGKAGEITLIAFDATPPQVDALRAGTISALIAQDPFAIGAGSVQELVDYLDEGVEGPVEPGGQILIPSAVVTAENVDSPEMEKYLYRTEC